MIQGARGREICNTLNWKKGYIRSSAFVARCGVYLVADFVDDDRGGQCVESEVASSSGLGRGTGQTSVDLWRVR
jgi:hypothetical protein